MTKKEQKSVDSQINNIKAELRLYKALRFSEPVDPDIPYPEIFSELSRGYNYNVYLASYGTCHSAYKACSSSFSHGDGWEKVSSQKPRSLYSKRLNALKMARYKLALLCAEALAKADDEIERESLNPSPDPPSDNGDENRI